MKRAATIFFQVVIVLIAIGAIVFLLWEPQVEGRNIGETLFEIYFTDPFLAYAYIGSIPFFVGLYQAFKALRYVGRRQTFSREVAQALRAVRYCALILICFVIGGEVIILLNRGSDDVAGGIFMGILVTLGSVVVATVAAIGERRVRRVMNTV